MSRQKTPDGRQPALALVQGARSAIPVTDEHRADEAAKVRLEPFWLGWRADRREYVVRWYDAGARTGRRIGTGVGPGTDAQVPVAAREALAAHFTAHARPAAPQAPADAGVSALLARYQSEHCARLKAPQLPAGAVILLEEFMKRERRAGLLPDFVTVADVNSRLVKRYMAWRKPHVVGETINRELSTLRGALNWAWKNELIVAAPFIASVPEEECSGARDLEWSPEQIAAILEAARAVAAREHVHLFTMTSLSTHFRTEAIVDLDLDLQLRGTLLHSLVPGDKQTRKRRSTVPVAPSFAPWIENRKGKLITYRVETARTTWLDDKIPEYFERPTYDIKHGFANTVVAAGLAHPTLGLVEPLLGADGKQIVRVYKRPDPATGRIPNPAPQWRAIGSPNTLRHTLHTFLQSVGVPQAQIDMAAGHNSEKGSGRNYTHLRPEYLRDFIEAVEAYWAQMDGLTRAHRRTHDGPKVIIFPAARAGAAK
jgi:site-specific recombinase XerD